MMRPTEDEQLAQVQAALLEILVMDLPPGQIVERLRADPRLAPYADWVASFEPRMIETAALLVKKWGRRGPAGAQPSEGPMTGIDGG